MTEPKFDPAAYWEERLSGEFGLGQVGFKGLGTEYNSWLYRVRSHVFRRTVMRLRKTWADARVLDVGSGTGFYLDAWTRLGVRDLTAVDITHAAVEKIGHDFPTVTAHQLDISEGIGELEPGSFDVISAFDMLFHIVEDRRYVQAFANLKSLLRPGGVLIFTDNFTHGEERRSQHHVTRPIDATLAALNAVGLESVQRRPAFVLMNEPIDSDSTRLKAWWRELSQLLLRHPQRGGLVGRVLYPVELVATRLVSEGPSTEVMVVRRPAKEPAGPSLPERLRRFVVVADGFADGEELALRPVELAQYAAVFAPEHDVTLAVPALSLPAGPPAGNPATENLGARIPFLYRVAGVPDARVPDTQIIELPTEAQTRWITAAVADAAYGEIELSGPSGASVPRFGPADLADLRDAAGVGHPDPSGDELPVVMCVWNRPESLAATIAMLERQHGVRPHLHIWLNDPAHSDHVHAVAARANIPVSITVSQENVAGFGRFLLTRELSPQPRYVVFIDDDQTIQEDALSRLLSEARPQTLTSMWAFRIRNPEDYWDRELGRAGELIDYAGTGGMIAEASIFSDERLYECPREYWENGNDLWLSFFATHTLGWELRASATNSTTMLGRADTPRSTTDNIVCVDDGREISTQYGPQWKVDYLRWLVSQGWELPTHAAARRD